MTRDETSADNGMSLVHKSEQWACSIDVIIVERIQYPNQLSHSGQDYQDVKELMGGAVYVEFTWIPTLGKFGL
jgi:hypothetical protein